MRFILSILTTFSVALFMLAGCQTFASSTKVEKVSNSTSAPKVDESAQSEEAPRITLEDAKKDFDAGTAVFIDTRGDDVPASKSFFASSKVIRGASSERALSSTFGAEVLFE